MNRFGSFLKPLIWFIALLLAAFVAGCGSDGGSGSTPSNSVTPIGVPSITVPDVPDPITALANTPPSNLRPDGELAEIFAYGGDHTDLQRELKLKEIVTKVVEWELPVYDVKQSGSGYKVQTSDTPRSDVFSTTKMVSTFLEITPRSENDRRFIENLKTGDLIRFKGAIKDSAMRTLEISPAILINEPEGNQGLTITKQEAHEQFSKAIGDAKFSPAERDMNLCVGTEILDEVFQNATVISVSTFERRMKVGMESMTRAMQKEDPKSILLGLKCSLGLGALFPAPKQ